MKLKLGLLVLSLLLASAAMADNFSLTAKDTFNNTLISAVLSGNASAPGVFDITSLSGTVGGFNASLLATSSAGTPTNSPVVNGWYLTYDNVLNMNTGNPYVDYYGIGFQLDTGGGSVAYGNLYYSGSYLYVQLGDNPPLQEVVTVSAMSTPEPSSLLLLGSGILGLGGLVRRKLR